jgi:hypothetical protein
MKPIENRQEWVVCPRSSSCRNKCEFVNGSLKCGHHLPHIHKGLSCYASPCGEELNAQCQVVTVRIPTDKE